MSDNATTFDDVREELARLEKRAASKQLHDLKAELSNNIFPFLEMLIEATETRIGETETLLSVGADETQIEPDFAEQLKTTFNIGLALCETLAKGNDDDVTRKRVAELMASYQLAATAAIQAVDDATLEAVEDEDEEDEDEAEDEDEEEEKDDPTEEPTQSVQTSNNNKGIQPEEAP